MNNRFGKIDLFYETFSILPFMMIIIIVIIIMIIIIMIIIL